MSNSWQEYKKKLGDSRPWHLLNSNNYVEDGIASSRYEICKLCPELIDLTKQCKQCGCIMTMKTKLINSSCPLSKW